MKLFTFYLALFSQIVCFAEAKKMLGGYIIDIDTSIYDLVVLRRSLKTPSTMIKNKKTGQIFLISTNSYPLNYKNTSDKSSWCLDGTKTEIKKTSICVSALRTTSSMTKSISLTPQKKLHGNIEVVHTISFSAKDYLLDEVSNEALILLQRIKK